MKTDPINNIAGVVTKASDKEWTRLRIERKFSQIHLQKDVINSFIQRTLFLKVSNDTSKASLLFSGDKILINVHLFSI